ncbi:EamA family transporter [Thermomonospora cellulosilytica]|uniref:Drug/metabolite transporter (DMT)-like permease n=1 Tax=Thermomonospora cellulosilytica TaxID=1411118 RepID=A0A7W3N177_9ACTN|nr:DMT family transporter [Thermomonospora cellulosilytica]MBA9005681.1 drug/metabolite transporter (DMT)-like permease [Thermomonospora cellulosilytica]
MAGTKAWGLTLAVISSICFGASGPFGKALIGAGLDPLQAVWVRVTGAALVLVPLVLVLRGRRAAAGARAHWPALAAYGAVAVAACQGLYFVAASRLPVGIAILLEFTGPVLVLAWIGLVRRARVPRAAAAGVAMAMAGLACVVEIWSGIGLDLLGLAAGLGAAACQAAYFLLVERMTGRVDPLVMTAAGMVAGSVLLTAVAAPWALPWQVLGRQVAVGDHAAPGWTLAAWIIVVSTVLAYLTGVAAVQRLSAPVAGAICYTEAVAATVIAWAALGERLTTPQLVGGVIVLAGAFVAQRTAASPGVQAPPPAPVPTVEQAVAESAQAAR